MSHIQTKRERDLKFCTRTPLDYKKTILFVFTKKWSWRTSASKNCSVTWISAYFLNCLVVCIFSYRIERYKNTSVNGLETFWLMFLFPNGLLRLLYMEDSIMLITKLLRTAILLFVFSYWLVIGNNVWSLPLTKLWI